jgi:hypothetical protein
MAPLVDMGAIIPQPTDLDARWTRALLGSAAGRGTATSGSAHLLLSRSAVVPTVENLLVVARSDFGDGRVVAFVTAGQIVEMDAGLRKTSEKLIARVRAGDRDIYC